MERSVSPDRIRKIYISSLLNYLRFPNATPALTQMLPSNWKGLTMASAAQIIANQANAQHSAGPVTPEGKARVAKNAIRHGLTSKHLVIRDDEREEFAVFQQSLLDELAPRGAVETITFHELLHAAWNLQRFRRIEAELSSRGPEDFTSPENASATDRLTRYQARAQRAWYRALQELRALQTNRALRTVKLEDPADPEVPAITDINDLTKQTQSEVTAEGLKHALNLLDLETGIFVRDARHRRALAGLSQSAGSSPLAAPRL
jgi:hypothetical protein